jgi:iron complex transport system ATP-binding protein
VSAAAALGLADVTVNVDGATLLCDVSLEVGAGALVVLVGPNGAGKTSILRTAVGRLTPSSGTVTLAGRPVSAYGGRARGALTGWLPQESLPAHDNRALDTVAAARFRFDEGRAASVKAARRALERVGAGALAERRLSTLSGGERQRVAIAALLAQEAPLLLVDEPANHLDPPHQIATYQLLGELWRDGFGIVCITHDINLVHHAVPVGDESRVRVVGIKGARVAFTASLDDPELEGCLARLYEVRVASVESFGRRHFLMAAGQGG